MTDYRYSLTREVAPLTGAGQLCWVGLNPSTADDTLDDQTIRRVTHFTIEAGYRSLIVVNLFAARATIPSDLVEMAVTGDPRGPDNAPAISRAFDGSAAAVAAWGASVPRPLRLVADGQIAFVRHVARSFGVPLLCLGVTADGHPRHPSRLGNDARLRPWDAAA